MKKVRILKMDSPEGETPVGRKSSSEKVRILKMDSPEGETPTDKKNFKYIHTHIYIYIYKRSEAHISDLQSQ